MPDNLTTFTSLVRNIGVARTNRYEVLLPKKLTGSDDDLIRLYCTRVNIPDVSLDTAEISIYGEQRTVPYRPRYGPATLSFYMDIDFKIKTAFDNWMALVSNPYGRTLGYYNDFVGSIEINVLPVSEDAKSYTVFLEEAYPKSFEGIMMDSSSKGPMLFTSVINYKYYRLGNAKPPGGELNIFLNDPLATNTYTGIPSIFGGQIA